MSNVIRFKKPASSLNGQDKVRDEVSVRKNAAKDRDLINRRIATQGGEAIESLGRWRTALPGDDRERLARNMDSLIREYKIKPGKLDWGRYGYQDKESFNRDLSRMRLPETADPGRRLLAHNTRWLHLIEMIQQFCIGYGEHVALEALAERLTRGTRFHPTKKIHSRVEKLLYSLNLQANEVDEKYGLLNTYRRIAEARAEYFELHMRDYYETSVDSFEYGEAMERPATYFTNIPEDKLPLFHRELGSYADEDWNDFLGAIPEDSRQYFADKRHDVDSWRANFKPDTTLLAGWTGEGTPSLSWYTDIEYLPRWFIGFYDHRHDKLLSQYADNTFSAKTGTLDPLENGNEPLTDREGYAYLVLYPNPGMSRIVPYLFSFYEEGSLFECLSENYLKSVRSDPIFPPVAAGSQAISRKLQDRIEEDYPLIKENWKNTAESLRNHPLLAWSNGRENMIDAEIERLTTGTRPPEKKEERNDS